MSELTDIIDRMVTEKTFSLDALEAVKELKDRAADLDLQVKTELKHSADWERQAKARKDENALLQAEIGVLKGRENAIAEREKAVTALEQRVAVAEAKEKAGVEMAERFLRLPHLRRNFSKTVGHVVPSSYQGGPPQTQYVTDTETTTEVEE